MKSTRILSAASAAALLGISSVALAQGTGRDASPGSSGAPSGSTMQRQDEPSAQKGARGSTAGERTTQGKDTQKSTQTRQGKEMQKSTQQQGKDMQKSTQKGMDQQKSTTGQSQMGKDAQPSQAQRPGAADTKSKMTREGQKGGTDTTVGAAGSGAVNLTTEQRTTIRQEVLTERAPRVDNVNFSISVGTVVPRTVRVVEVPPAIIKIRPAWKGYRYFVYNDEIIIVEPRSLKIVAVLDV